MLECSYNKFLFNFYKFKEILRPMSESLTNTSQKTSHYYYRPRIISIHTFKILFYLTKREGSAYFSEIKTYLNRSSSQVSQIMRRIKAKNYVKGDNCRPLKYSITELGRKVNKQTIKDFLRYRDDITEFTVRLSQEFAQGVKIYCKTIEIEPKEFIRKP